MASHIKTALDQCQLSGAELMPVQKLRYFEKEQIPYTQVPGSQIGFFRVNALHNGISIEN